MSKLADLLIKKVKGLIVPENHVEKNGRVTRQKSALCKVDIGNKVLP
ncbi:hypothetical protein H6770_05380 [Candidatus Peribacteria bacterium]|nr:hypothetical protein [Candidatus Peribacteria bacterium]